MRHGGARRGAGRRGANARRHVIRGTALLLIGLLSPAEALSTEYTAKVDVQASVKVVPCLAGTVPCEPRAVVSAALTATRIPGHGSPCPTGSTSLFLSGPPPVSGSYEVGGSAQAFPISDTTTADYALGPSPREVQVLAEGHCEDAEYGFLSPYVKVELPASHSVETPGATSPIADGADFEPLIGSPSEAETAEVADYWPSALGCAATRSRAWGYAATLMCRLAARVAASAAFASTDHVPVSSETPPPETPSFALARFASGTLVPPACKARHARGVHSRPRRAPSGCAALEGAGRAWSTDMAELAWLYERVADDTARYNPSPASGSSSAASENGWMLRAAVAAYLARASEVEQSLVGLDGRIAGLLRKAKLDVRFSRRTTRRALSSFSHDRDVPTAVNRELESNGVRSPRAFLAQLGASGPAPRSLSGLFEAAAAGARQFSPSSLAPHASALLLTAWVGTAAAGLLSACGSAFEAAWDRVRSATSAPPAPGQSYRLVLARALLLHGSVPASFCETASPTFSVQADPLSATFPSQPSVLVPSLDVSAQGLGDATDVAVAPEGSLLVNDELSANAKRYSAGGSLLGTFGSEGEGEGQFSQPADVATDPSGRVYVTDYRLHHVLRFSAGGSYEATIGTQGEGVGQFEHPAGVAWNAATGELVVVDAPNGPGAGHGRLEAFDATGKPLWATTGSPGEASYMVRPRGVGVAPNGDIAVADSNLEDPRVLLFDPSGRLLGVTPPSIGLVQPYGVAFDASGDLWVADRGDGLVELSGVTGVAKRYAVFGPSGEALAPSAIAFDGERLLILDFAGQQLVSVPVGEL
jgi:NHL repeat